MRKYNKLIMFSVFMYLAVALIAGYAVRKADTSRDKAYKVEINRIYNSLSGDMSPDRLDLRTFRYVKAVTFLAAEDIESEEKAGDFFAAGNTLKSELHPLFADGFMKGILRFDYQEPGYNIRSLLIIVQVCLGVLELFVMAVLIYLKYQLIRPFQKLTGLQEDIAKGHLTGIVKEEKNKYFGNFMRSLGQMKDALEVSGKRRLELEREKKKMLMSLSHDIKTPLNTIKLYGKALEEELYKDEEQKKTAARQIGVNAARIGQYVEEIMKSSREDILDIHVKNEEFYLAELMRRVLDAQDEKCSIRMLKLQTGDFTDRLLKGDIDRAVEVFDNIFENAFKYGDNRKIEISFYEEDYCQLIRIFNTGMAVSDNEFNHIFESFYRGTNSTGKQGNGLGLYICREIMRKMGGEIFAEKEKNGMAFVLVFR
ncbi:HAMP domain-containing sensor histidine kinase [Murimonas intestini]|uniref:histidine kinase n=1 Tax=Murimonas intestini TaxID=1337051 RepID=A0AB73T216_9FIRM|nr:HAMP domain-containing sensor histidine kinase [Murimonas intestini]MCR1842578.1 HAMP domain-containing histidine kinase [Murimonas intestini]MCR1867375.1 HAMP domain-containing histidine kinase [Murimonas intestini]MCR1884562.1 HAMP domain-containing histidine kinase [Murimonas intestini]